MAVRRGAAGEDHRESADVRRRAVNLLLTFCLKDCAENRRASKGASGDTRIVWHVCHASVC